MGLLKYGGIFMGFMKFNNSSRLLLVAAATSLGSFNAFAVTIVSSALSGQGAGEYKCADSKSFVCARQSGSRGGYNVSCVKFQITGNGTRCQNTAGQVASLVASGNNSFNVKDQGSLVGPSGNDGSALGQVKTGQGAGKTEDQKLADAKKSIEEGRKSDMPMPPSAAGEKKPAEPEKKADTAQEKPADAPRTPLGVKPKPAEEPQKDVAQTDGPPPMPKNEPGIADISPAPGVAQGTSPDGAPAKDGEFSAYPGKTVSSIMAEHHNAAKNSIANVDKPSDAPLVAAETPSKPDDSVNVRNGKLVDKDGQGDSERTLGVNTDEDRKNSHSANAKTCSQSNGMLKDGSSCKVSRDTAEAVGITSTIGDQLGSTSANIGSSIAIGTAKQEKMGDTYRAAASAQDTNGAFQTALAGMNLVGASIMASRWGGHKMDENSFNGMVEHFNEDTQVKRNDNGPDTWQIKSGGDRQVNETRGLTKMGYDSTSFTQEQGQDFVDRASAAAEEQGAVKAEMRTATLAMTAKAMTYGMGAAQSFVQAEANRKNAALSDAQETKAQSNWESDSEQHIAPETISPTTTSNPDDQASTDDNSTLGGAPGGLGNPFNDGMREGPTPLAHGDDKKGGGAGGGANPGGGAGGAPGGLGPTTAATDPDADKGPRAAEQGKTGNYAMTGAASGSGGGGNRGGGAGGGMPDLASLIANAFGKKDDANRSPSGILAFGGGAAGADSLLSPDVDLFARIHDAYQEKQRIQSVGLLSGFAGGKAVNNVGRGVAGSGRK